MRTLVLSVCVLALLSALGAAQPHPQGVIVGGGYPGTDLSYLNGLYQAGKGGSLSTIVDTYLTARPYWADDVQMNTDNQSIIFACRGTSSSLYPMKYGLFTFDPASGKFMTVASSTRDFRHIYGFTVDQDGDWLVCSQCYDSANKTTYGIFKVKNTGKWTTLLTTASLGHRQAFYYPVRRDIDSGDLLIPSYNKVGFFTRPVYALSHHGQLTTWNQSNGGPQPTYGWSQEISTGDIVCLNGNYLYRCPQGRGATDYKRLTGMLPSGTYGYGMIYENQACAKPQLIVYGMRQLTTLTQASLYWVDPATAKVTSIVPFLTATKKVSAPWSQSIMGQYRGRNFQTVMTAPGQWNMVLSFPDFPGRNYVVAANLTGISPGFLLPDGRHVWLNYDDLVWLTVDRKINLIFNPGPGQLDNKGGAKGYLDLRFITKPFGVTVHIVVGVLDPKAPHGIAFITEPYPFQI